MPARNYRSWQKCYCNPTSTPHVTPQVTPQATPQVIVCAYLDNMNKVKLGLIVDVDLITENGLDVIKITFDLIKSS